MKRPIIFIISALLLILSTTPFAAEKPSPFDPKIHGEENLPVGILYISSGKIDFITQKNIVVDDAEYPFDAKVEIYDPNGRKMCRKNLKKGQKVDIYANDSHKAVYIIIK